MSSTPCRRCSILGPIIAYFVTKRICLALQKKDREIALHGYESGRIVRLPGGEYIEVHQPVDEYERWTLIDFETNQPLMVRPNSRGQIPWHENIRASLSRWFFEDRLTPLTQGELDAAVAHQHHELEHIAHDEAEELQGAHARAGVPDAPLKPIDDGHSSETAVRPSNVIIPDDKDGKKKSRPRPRTTRTPGWMTTRAFASPYPRHFGRERGRQAEPGRGAEPSGAAASGGRSGPGRNPAQCGAPRQQ